MPQVSKTVKADLARYPLVGVHNTRLIGSGSAIFSASGIVGLGVVGVMIVGGTTAAAKDQRLVNAIPDVVINPMTNNTRYYCYKRPGVATSTTPEAGSIGTALRVWTGNSDKVISAFGATNSTIYDGTSSLGAITGVATDITETFVGTTANLVIPVNNSRTYYYPAAGALTQIVDVDYPGNAGYTITGTYVHLDGYSFIMTTDGNIWNSDLNSISSWTSTSFVAANMYPDKGVGLARYKDLIVAFGKETTEFFRDVGNATGSPLQKVNEAFLKLGAIGPEAICQLEDNIAWVASTDTGSVSVYMLDGYKPVRISDNVVDTQLALRGSGTVYVTSCKLFGKTFIFVIFGSSTHVYCMEDKMWHEWQGSLIRWHKFSTNSAAGQNIYSISRDSTSGKVYKIDAVSPVYTDDGDTYTMTIQTGKIDFDSERRKFLHKLTLVGDIQSSSTPVYISWTDDDYVTFSASRSVDLANTRRTLANCGQFRRRAFKLTCDAALPVRLEELEFEYTKGIH